MPSPLTCHILDTVSGKPATNVVCAVYKLDLDNDTNNAIIKGETQVALAKTNDDGRVTEWVFEPSPAMRSELRNLGILEKTPEKLEWDTLQKGFYKIRFHTGSYFKQKNAKSFFPFVDIVFEVSDARHYHIPLLLSSYGYTTYRGS